MHIYNSPIACIILFFTLLSMRDFISICVIYIGYMYFFVKVRVALFYFIDIL